jgi:hypothetical protein
MEILLHWFSIWLQAGAGSTPHHHNIIKYEAAVHECFSNALACAIQAGVKTICRHRKKVLQNKLRLTSLLPAEYLCIPKGAKLNSPKCHTHSIQNERGSVRAPAIHSNIYKCTHRTHVQTRSTHWHATLAANWK